MHASSTTRLTGYKERFLGRFGEVHLRDGVMRSLDRFWGFVEVDINPDLDGQRDDIDLDGIRSGSGLVLDYVCDLAGLD